MTCYKPVTSATNLYSTKIFYSADVEVVEVFFRFLVKTGAGQVEKHVFEVAKSLLHLLQSYFNLNKSKNSKRFRLVTEFKKPP